MRKGIYILPNTLTLCGMFCGFYAILASFRGDFIHAASAILIANIFDGLDGWVARLTNSTTKFGVELDSLSDLVAFGVAPAVLIYSWTLQSFGRIGLGAAFIFVICGALRLARYNVQKETTESKAFTGLPIPAAGTAIASLVLFYTEIWGTNVELNSAILLLPFFLAVLMVTTLRFHSLKELDFKKRKPFWLLVAIVMAILFIIMYPETVIFAFTATYIIWGVIEGTYIIHKKRKYKEII
ncbi:CDP-alcohol phosphatidyltransferase [bacterium BMS3Abin09]|nr:CDP-alcohol phosphatidyltransferase [bacterium BMS3Abin09]HDH34165.1 CDP-diacylglycerol--serine O-phosphatidyltransferase [Nitrospirota bacterium]HDN95194.1 CDP-diacylglycerol--serine O-phosphatidyltransferase [Nitrospirota bacterium]HDO66726.1 CDP-diacylglycerol--serine O-phosphatidyltransferase [Nitrospirota bacterium]HEW80900.1 CDP-diacylglycerol--serine O-phosphatidyltransferase [Nitrospirota bacterium]